MAFNKDKRERYKFMKKLEYFFQQLKLLEMKYEKLSELYRDQFNIFSILRKESDEVNLHSKFIFELLNPNGTHQQGNIFFKLFIKEICKINFKDDNPDIFREKYNIDILIASPNQAIIIENKIYTEDHSGQLSKYLKIVKNKGYNEENIFLIYLSLFGDEPNEKLVQDKVINISYKKDILNWLENCIKEVALIPTIRETISQYINLVKKLTNQSQYEGFIMEVKDFLLSDANNLKMALDIQESITKAKISVQLSFWETLNKLLSERNYKFIFYSDNNDKDFESSVENFYKKQRNKRYFGLRYKLQENLYFFIEINWQIYYGFTTFNKGNISNLQMEIINQIDTTWDGKDNGIYWKFPKNKLNFESFNDPNILNLVNEKSKIENIKIIVDDIINILTSYNELYDKK